jgi:hypothetical protein
MADESTVEQRLERVEAAHAAMREEMRAGFARMATREELQATREELQATREEMQATREEMQVGFAQMATREELRAGLAQMATREELRAMRDESVAANVELREYIEFVSQRHAGETRHYFDVVADGLRNDIRKVAEAEVATTERIDRLEQKMDGGFADLRRDIAGIIVAFKGRDRRVRRR